jgi:DNA-binding transcriptional MerR regulator
VVRDLSGEEFMTVAEVAALLKLNQQTIRNWIDAGPLPAPGQTSSPR